MSGLDDIESLLRDWIGLDVATVGRAALERAVRQRMERLELTDSATYARLVRGETAERDELVEEVIVAESWFFRDRQVFEFVADFAATRASVPGRSPVRILCGPAAGGEEPYSMAMALFEAGLAAEQFTIDAIDISRRALHRAAAGRYSANAFRNADASFRDRWFTVSGSHAEISVRIRNQVRLEWANLLDPAFAAHRPRYDVVFCRNLLIYLTDEARRQVERQLDRLLAADGLLVLGAAEPPIMKGDWLPAGGGAAPPQAPSRSPAAGRDHFSSPLRSPSAGGWASPANPRGGARRGGPAGQRRPLCRRHRTLRAAPQLAAAGCRTILPDGDAAPVGRRS